MWKWKQTQTIPNKVQEFPGNKTKQRRDWSGPRKKFHKLSLPGPAPSSPEALWAHRWDRPLWKMGTSERWGTALGRAREEPSQAWAEMMPQKGWTGGSRVQANLSQSHLGLASQDEAVPRPRAVWPLRWSRICVSHKVLTLRSEPVGRGEQIGSTSAHGVTMSLNGQSVGPSPLGGDGPSHGLAGWDIMGPCTRKVCSTAKYALWGAPEGQERMRTEEEKSLKKQWVTNPQIKKKCETEQERCEKPALVTCKNIKAKRYF